jgi:hypothetical protein
MMKKDEGLNGSHEGKREETDRQNKKDRTLGTTRSNRRQIASERTKDETKAAKRVA